MLLKILVFIDIVSRHNVELFNMGIKNTNNYGPYTTDLSRYDYCKGPKPRDVASFEIRNLVVNGNQTGLYNMTFHEQVRIEDIKITTFTGKGSHKTKLWNYRLTKPCQHFALIEVMKATLNTDNYCVVQKGIYVFKLNFNEFAKTFFGTSFFYGEYELKAIVLSPKGNVMCVIVYPAFLRIPNSTS